MNDHKNSPNWSVLSKIGLLIVYHEHMKVFITCLGCLISEAIQWLYCNLEYLRRSIKDTQEVLQKELPRVLLVRNSVTE